MSMSETQLGAFMREPNVAVLASVGPDGRPHQVPVWHLWEDGVAYVFTGRGSRKWRNLLANPEVSLCVERSEPPYAYAIVQGTAEEDDTPLRDVVLKMAMNYYGEERAEDAADRYTSDDPSLVLFKIVPRTVVTWEQPADDV